MPTRIKSDPNDAWIQSGGGSNYATARNGGSLAVVTTGGTFRGGQYKAGANFFFDEGFLAFDGSRFSDFAVFGQAYLRLWGRVDDSAQDHIIEVRLHPWGPALTTADFVPGANLAALALVASLPSLGVRISMSASVNGYNDFTNEGTGVRAAINRNGFVYFIISTDRQRLGNVPVTNVFEMVHWLTEDQPFGKPQLVVPFYIITQLGLLPVHNTPPNSTMLGLNHIYRDAAFMTVAGMKAAA